MPLTEFGKAIGKGQGQEAGQTFQRECVRTEADFAAVTFFPNIEEILARLLPPCSVTCLIKAARLPERSPSRPEAIVTDSSVGVDVTSLAR